MAKRYEITEFVPQPWSRVADRSVIRGLDWAVVERRILWAGHTHTEAETARKVTEAGNIYSFHNASGNYCQLTAYEA